MEMMAFTIIVSIMKVTKSKNAKEEEFNYWHIGIFTYILVYVC